MEFKDFLNDKYLIYNPLIPSIYIFIFHIQFKEIASTTVTHQYLKTLEMKKGFFLQKRMT